MNEMKADNFDKRLNENSHSLTLHAVFEPLP